MVEAGPTLNTSGQRAGQSMHRSNDIKLVDFHVAADLDAPVKALLENALPQPVHLGNIVNALAVVLGGAKLNHTGLPALLGQISNGGNASAPVQLHRCL